MADDVRQPADPVPQPPARPVEEVDALVSPDRRRPPSGGDEGAVGGDGGGVGLADIAGAGGQAERAQEAAVGGGPDADRLVVRGGDQEAALAVGVEARRCDAVCRPGSRTRKGSGWRPSSLKGWASHRLANFGEALPALGLQAGSDGLALQLVALAIARSRWRPGPASGPSPSRAPAPAAHRQGLRTWCRIRPGRSSDMTAKGEALLDHRFQLTLHAGRTLRHHPLVEVGEQLLDQAVEVGPRRRVELLAFDLRRTVVGREALERLAPSSASVCSRSRRPMAR